MRDLRHLAAVGLLAACVGAPASAPAPARQSLATLPAPLSAPPAVPPAARPQAEAVAHADSVLGSYDRIEAQVPMRDGVALHTIVFVPKRRAGPIGILLNRTPYGIANGGRALAGPYADLAADGYAFAFQDIRGRFGSEGEFVMMRPVRDRADPKAIDESTDAWDTVEWLLRTVPGNNGRVGMLGVSYGGWLTVMAMLDPHPALKAVSPQASPADMFLGDDFHHNGAFRLSYGFEYAAMMERGKGMTAFEFDRPDVYDWYLDLGPLSNVNARHLKGAVPTWNDFATRVNYDAFWQRQGVTQFLDSVRVPTLNVAGWWDQEDFYGPLTIYRTLERRDARDLNYLVVGPWSHGGWNGATGQKLGDLDFGRPTALEFRRHIQRPWFAHWLKGEATHGLPEAITFQAGGNRWVATAAWPPREAVERRRLYTHADRRLSFAPPPGGAGGADAYVSDPANPVPYRARPIRPSFTGGSTWSRWLVDDQRFLQGRPDVLTWMTEPLAQDVVLAGDIVAHLFASTTGTDADWVVKLIDVFPDAHPENPALAGDHIMVANDVMRGRFRESFTTPKPITPDSVTEYVVSLHSQHYRFRAGHRIAVQVQSTWFPLIDRNPQTFVPNIFEARAEDFRAATHRIHRSPGAATYVEMMVRSAGR